MNWTIADAWKALNMGRDVDPPKAEDVESEHITEFDRLIGAAVGTANEESLKKIHAAVAYGLPRFTTHRLPSAESGKSSLRHAADVAIECVREHCDEDGITKRERRPVVKALETLDFSGLCSFDWFLIWDALGCSGKIKDQETLDFYKFAGEFKHYLRIAEAEERAVAK